MGHASYRAGTGIAHEMDMKPSTRMRKTHLCVEALGFGPAVHERAQERHPEPCMRSRQTTKLYEAAISKAVFKFWSTPTNGSRNNSMIATEQAYAMGQPMLWDSRARKSTGDKTERKNALRQGGQLRLLGVLHLAPGAVARQTRRHLAKT
jgi:hypothetical protein